MNAQCAKPILIVEDERIVAKDLQQSLNEMGYDAFAIASSAEEALACAAERCPEVVLMDIRIKGIEDGIQTAQLLKTRFPVSIIYLTAHADDRMLERAKRTEPNGYLLKPVKAIELRSMLEMVLYKREVDLTRSRLQASERRLAAITDNVPVSIAYFDRDGRVQFANRVFRELIPFRDNAVGAPASMVLGSPLHRESYVHRQRALSGERVSFLTVFHQNGAGRKHEVTYIPDCDANGAVVGVYSIGYDVTEREQLGTELRQARLDLETILHHIPAGITSWDPDLTNRFANSAAEERFSVPPGRACGMHMKTIMGDVRFEAAKPVIESALCGLSGAHSAIEPLPDGTVRYMHDEYVPEVTNGTVVGLIALSTDVTQLRQSHEQIRDFALRLETVREEERRKVAGILHDGIAQDLFAVKLGLDFLEAANRERPDTMKNCRELNLSIVKCMNDTRSLANTLHPVALTNLPVSTVIRNHALFFAEYARLKIDVTEENDLPRLNDAEQLLMFRAAQEALTNVARHAVATSVEVKLRSDRAQFIMEIGDDGIGITPAAMNKAQSLGLVSLRERFEALGGCLTAERRQPKGTTVTVCLPESPRESDDPV